MHIPDGYLSPVTCAVLYAAAAPFWAIALRRVKKLLNTRLVPLLSVFAAFSFVIMMFNIPLPGERLDTPPESQSRQSSSAFGVQCWRFLSLF
jgi:ABC-type Co2+ transport system permease subunit